MRTSQAVQIDHVALGDAWQTGAQQLQRAQHFDMANDPLSCSRWTARPMSKGRRRRRYLLPPNKGFRCADVARQVAVKAEYRLWVTVAEQAAIDPRPVAVPRPDAADERKRRAADFLIEPP